MPWKREPVSMRLLPSTSGEVAVAICGCQSGLHKSEPDIVQFRAGKIAAVIMSPCHQHLAVGQQRRRVRFACGVEAARGTPGPAGRVVQFRAGKIAAVILPLPPAPCRWAATSPCDKSRAVLRLPVAVQVPLAGSYSSALVR